MIIKKVETQPPIGSLTTDVLKVTLENNNIIYVPNDEANKDYQEIQKWIADGGTIINNGGGE